MARLEVLQFPARSDNFGVLLHEPDSGRTVAIDAPEADAVMDALNFRGWKLTEIFVTHKHFDHIDGIPTLKAAFNVTVTGPAFSAVETGMYDRTVKDGDVIDFAGKEVRVIGTPGHTLDHVTYWFPEDKLVFAADLIFSLGCGRVIEGDHAMMWNSIRRIRELPDDTALYCGHEYTLANGRFAATIEPNNAALKERIAEVNRLRDDEQPTLPTTIGREKATNPFLRADHPELQQAIGMVGEDPALVFGEIRTRKDRF